MTTDVNIRISAQAHKKIKISAAKLGISMKDMVEILSGFEVEVEVS